MRHLTLPLAALLVATLVLGKDANAQGIANLSLSPAQTNAAVGDVVELAILASAQDDQPTEIGALDALVVYDPAVLKLLGNDQTGAGYSWFVVGFLTDPDNINASIEDGDAKFTALSQITLPATATSPPGLQVTTLRFEVLAASAGTSVSFAPTIGSFGETKVLDFFVSGLNITGDISSMATVVVAGAPTQYCGGELATCPCSNDGAPGEGCRNSTGSGALLSAAGSTSLAADDLVLTASNLTLNQSGIIYMGPNQIQLPFGDGLRCVGGGSLGVVRFPVMNSGAGGSMTLGPNFLAPTVITAGQTWNFQSWYRDPGGPCGNAFNLSNAVSATFAL
jgi:hypothetical protein